MEEGRGLDAREEVLSWLAAAKRGDEEAFGRLVRSYYQPLFRLAFQMVPCAQDAEEILQDAFFRFYKALGRLREGQDPFPFLRTVVVRRTYSFLKKARAEHLALEDLPEDLPDFAVAGRPLDVRALYSWAGKLPPQRRLVFLLREVLGVPDEEIGELLSIRQPTVRRHASLAREAFLHDFGG